MEVSPDWLTRRVEDAPTSFAAGRPDRAALLTRMAWQKLKGRAREGDELWAFANPPSTWRKLGKHTGYAILRAGTIVESVSTS
ncbi:MAG TPA: hypothetical protein VF746_15675 [Longimicrobium sp.]|jgi:hypothetical protein